jgi:GxxExxY protein
LVTKNTKETQSSQRFFVYVVVLRVLRNLELKIYQVMTEEDIVKIILDESFHIHKTIGPGMLENVYKTCLAYRLQQRGLFVETEKAVPVFFEQVKMECGYRADIVVEKKVVVDTKAIEAIGPLQVAQVLTYLRFLNLRYGLILNFNVVLLKDGIKRVLHGYGA